MTLTIAQESPLTEDVARLLNGSEAALRAANDTTACSTCNAEEQSAETIRFFVARKDGRPTGCVALGFEGDYAENNRLFKTPDVRGEGVAKALIYCLENEAHQAGCTQRLLESGTELTAAAVHYDVLGYESRGPFAGYEPGETTVLMEKRL
ncbi:MAG: GNAT family N-acetyltransferase [Pseudomonadota bacterium]